MIYVVLPIYNERENIAPLIERTRAVLKSAGLDYRIVAVDDGCTDGTGAVLDELHRAGDMELIRHKLNRGLGETIRDGFEFAAFTGSSADIIVRMDADESHDPELIPRLAAAIRDGADVAIASRYADGGGESGLSLHRSVVSKGASAFMKFFFSIDGVRDFSCGYRAYRVDLIRQVIEILKNDFISLKGVGFTCTVEKLIKLSWTNARFAEVPFTLHYERKKSSSKSSPRLTVLGYLLLAFKYFRPWGSINRTERALLANVPKR